MRNPICKLCKRNEAAKNVCVYGHTVDSPNADIMIVIDNLNQAQDQEQSLIAGQGGNVLKNLLLKAGILHRCYITSAVKCNASHKPIAKEIRACRPYLLQEIDTLKPSLIICMGAIAAKAIFDKPYTLKDLRQRFFDAFQTQVAVTYSYNVIFTDPNKVTVLEKDLQWILANWNKTDTKFEYKMLVNKQADYSFINGCDVETTGLQIGKDDMLTIAVANPTTKIVQGFNITHPDNTDILEPDLSFIDDNHTLVGHHIKFDVKAIEHQFKTKVKAKLLDTSIAHAMIDENSIDNDLKSLAAIYTNVGHYEDNLDRKNLKNEPFDKVIKYNGMDAAIPVMLMEKFYPELKRQGLVKIFNFVCDMIPIFKEMEQTGAYINFGELRSLYDIHEPVLKRIKTKYPNINFNSGPQLGKILYKVLGCPILATTKKDKASTSKDTLLMLKAYPNLNDKQAIFIDDILDYRKADKVIDHLNEIMEYSNNNRVFTSYNLAKAFDESGTMRGTVTGRLSSSQANLQNKPPEVRKIFQVTPGWKHFVSADYSQIELRVAAFLSKEPNLLKAFNEGLDVHTSVLCDIMNADYNEINKIIKDEYHPQYKHWNDLRLTIKRVNFGILYGIQADHLAKIVLQMGVKLSIDKVKEIINAWKAKNLTLMSWIRSVEDATIISGQYKTIFGRIRHLPGASRRTEMGMRVLRQGMNFPIQSAASDICLLGIRGLWNQFQVAENEEQMCRLLMVVHDEIDFETKFTDEQFIKDFTKHILIKRVKDDMLNEFGIDFNIPLDVDVKVGTYWKK